MLFPTAVEPQLIPDRAPNGDRWYGSAPYLTGFPWPPSQIRRFGPHFFIVQTPVQPWKYAKVARCIDVESLAVEVDEVPGFVNARNDFRGDALVYCDFDYYTKIRASYPDLKFDLFAAAWDGSPDPVTWLGQRDWAKQFDPRPDYQVCALHEKSF